MPSYGLGMGEAAATALGAPYDTLVSGGAADCVIIAAYNRRLSRAYMVHAHRETHLASVVDQINQYILAKGAQSDVQIELASQVFGTPRPTDSGLVRNVYAALEGAGYHVAHAHGVTSLSLNIGGRFVAGVVASSADRHADDASTTMARVSFKLLAPELAGLPGGKKKSKESPI